ncbi:hypothetical protein KY289_002697 [Solanum tuberosum]|nr:hypothetical protein KY289_002697 [Solanum tuberosum]
MSSSGMDATDGKEVVVKANIRETPKTHRETELSSSSSSSKTQLSNNVSTDESIQKKVYRDSSYDFSNDAAMKRMRDNIKDFDFVTESPFSWESQLSRVEESPNHGILRSREVRVSFNRNLASNGSVRRRSNLITGSSLKDEVVLSISSSFWRKSHLLAATRTKSRLMDPPEQKVTEDYYSLCPILYDLFSFLVNSKKNDIFLH